MTKSQNQSFSDSVVGGDSSSYGFESKPLESSESISERDISVYPSETDEPYSESIESSSYPTHQSRSEEDSIEPISEESSSGSSSSERPQVKKYAYPDLEDNMDKQLIHEVGRDPVGLASFAIDLAAYEIASQGFEVFRVAG